MDLKKLIKKLKKKTHKKNVSDIEKLAIQVNITNIKPGTFYFEVKNNEINIEPYEYNDKDGDISLEVSTLNAIIDGKLDYEKAIEEEKIDISRDKSVVKKFLRIIGYTERDKNIEKVFARWFLMRRLGIISEILAVVGEGVLAINTMVSILSRYEVLLLSVGLLLVVIIMVVTLCMYEYYINKIKGLKSCDNILAYLRYISNIEDNRQYRQSIRWFFAGFVSYCKNTIKDSSIIGLYGQKIVGMLYDLTSGDSVKSCYAYNNKEDFQKFAIKVANLDLIDNKDGDILNELEKLSDNIKIHRKEDENSLPGLPKSIAVYLAVGVIHLLGCLLSTLDGNLVNFFSNLCFYAPSDVIYILIYNKVIDQVRQNN